MRLAIVLLLLASPGRADEDTSRARAHYEIGNGMYRLGDYQGALREFAAGYELTKKPGFLINLGQTYRKLHDPVRARDLYRQYLASTAADDPARPQVVQVLADLDKEIASAPVVSPLPSPAPSVAPVLVVEKPAPRRHRKLQIAGIVLGVVGVGLVGGGGGATAVAEDSAKQLTALTTFDPQKDDQYHLDRALEYSLFGVGAALAVTGIVLIALGSR